MMGKGSVVCIWSVLQLFVKVRKQYQGQQHGTDLEKNHTIKNKPSTGIQMPHNLTFRWNPEIDYGSGEQNYGSQGLGVDLLTMERSLA